MGRLFHPACTFSHRKLRTSVGCQDRHQPNASSDKPVRRRRSTFSNCSSGHTPARLGQSGEAILGCEGPSAACTKSRNARHLRCKPGCPTAGTEPPCWQQLVRPCSRRASLSRAKHASRQLSAVFGAGAQAGRSPCTAHLFRTAPPRARAAHGATSHVEFGSSRIYTRAGPTLPFAAPSGKL